VISRLGAEDFLLIVTKDEQTGVKTFASTIGFDNMVPMPCCSYTIPFGLQLSSVWEYLDTSMKNVLVKGSNATTCSDSHIFSSNGNVTMQR
jgi:hypothetical protein